MRVQITLWIFLAIIVSWVVSGALSCLLVRAEMLTLRQHMLDRPDLYPAAIPEPHFQIWDLLLGPQSIIPQGDHPPSRQDAHPALPVDRDPHPDAGPAEQPPPDGTPDGPPERRPPEHPSPHGPPMLISNWISGWHGVLLRAGVASLMALCMGVVLGRRFTRPLLALDRGARAYRQRQLAYRIPLQGDNEFTEVAAAMNDMAEQVAAHIAEVEDDARRRRQLLADVAHELRSPVMTLRTMAGALADGTAADPTRHARAVESLERTSDRLLHLVTDLLQLAKLDLHELPIHRQRCDLREVVAACVRAQADAARAAGLSLHADLPTTPVMADVDADRLAQVLDNLLENAVSYAGAGAQVHVQLTDGNPLHLQVADSGRGIPARHLPYLFDPFYRVDAARSPKDNHSGLGLRIARGLIEAHGGRLQLSSVEGEGTTALITLPQKF